MKSVSQKEMPAKLFKNEGGCRALIRVSFSCDLVPFLLQLKSKNVARDSREQLNLDRGASKQELLLQSLASCVLKWLSAGSYLLVILRRIIGFVWAQAVKATRRDAVMDKLEASLQNFEACTQRNHTYRWTREKCKFGPLWCNVGSKLRRVFSWSTVNTCRNL